MLIYLLGIDGGKITYDIAGCASLGPDFATKIGLMYRPLLCATLNGQENVRIVVCTVGVERVFSLGETDGPNFGHR